MQQDQDIQRMVLNETDDFCIDSPLHLSRSDALDLNSEDRLSLECCILKRAEQMSSPREFLQKHNIKCGSIEAVLCETNSDADPVSDDEGNVNDKGKQNVAMCNIFDETNSISSKSMRHNFDAGAAVHENWLNEFIEMDLPWSSQNTEQTKDELAFFSDSINISSEVCSATDQNDSASVLQQTVVSEMADLSPFELLNPSHDTHASSPSSISQQKSFVDDRLIPAFTTNLSLQIIGKTAEVACLEVVRDESIVCSILAPKAEIECKSAGNQVVCISQHTLEKDMSFDIDKSVHRIRYQPRLSKTFLCADEEIHILDHQRATLDLFATSSDNVRDICIGDRFISATGYSKSVIFWDIETGKCTRNHKIHDVASSVNLLDNDTKTGHVSWTTDSGNFELYDVRVGAVVLKHQSYWAAASNVFAHNYLTCNEVLLAGGQGFHSLLDIRRCASSLYETSTYDASRVRFTNRDSHVKAIGDIRIRSRDGLCAFFGRDFFSLWSYSIQDETTRQQYWGYDDGGVTNKGRDIYCPKTRYGCGGNGCYSIENICSNSGGGSSVSDGNGKINGHGYEVDDKTGKNCGHGQSIVNQKTANKFAFGSQFNVDDTSGNIRAKEILPSTHMFAEESTFVTHGAFSASGKELWVSNSKGFLSLYDLAGYM